MYGEDTSPQSQSWSLQLCRSSGLQLQLSRESLMLKERPTEWVGLSSGSLSRPGLLVKLGPLTHSGLLVYCDALARNGLLLESGALSYLGLLSIRARYIRMGCSQSLARCSNVGC